MGGEIQFIQVSGTQGGALIVKCRCDDRDITAWTLDAKDTKGQPYYAQSRSVKTSDGRSITAAVFPTLPVGNYQVYNPWGPDRKVTVFPGVVSEVSL